MSKKVILVTGGSGLVGKAIETVIKNEGPNDEKWIFIGTKDGDLSSLDDTEAIFAKHKPTHVIHLAAKVGGLFDNMAHNLSFLTANLQINQNVLSCSYKAGVEKVVSCLSTCIFPDKTTYPIDETMVHNGPPHPSNFGYSHAKRLLDVFNHAYAEECSVRYTSIVPCNVYGPYDNFNLKSSHVIPALIRKFYDRIEKGEDTLTVLGSGKPLRQFIYSMDLAKLIIWTLRSYDEIEPIILSVDESNEVTIAELAGEIVEAFHGLKDFNAELVFDASAADGQLKKTASNAKLRRYLPDFKFTPLQDGIKATVKWFIENHDKARL